MLREFKGYAAFGLGFFVVLELMLVAAVYFWPTFEENIEAIRNMASAVTMLSQLVGQIDQFGVTGYVVGQHFFKGCGALGTAAAVLFAANAIAGEAHRGTMEMWLARPVSRFRLMSERWAGGALAVVIPVFVSSATTPALMTIVDKSMDMSDLMRCSVHMSAFLLAIYSLTFLWSSYGSDPMRISFAMLFGAILVFALYLVEGLTNYSLYRLVDIEVFMDIVHQDRLDWRMVGPLLGVSAMFFGLSLRGFRTRVP